MWERQRDGPLGYKERYSKGLHFSPLIAIDPAAAPFSTRATPDAAQRLTPERPFMTHDFISLAIIGLIAAVAPFIANLIPKKPVPETVLLLAGGAVLGPHMVNVIWLDESVSLLSDLGCAMLFLLAGYEINPKPLRDAKASVALPPGESHWRSRLWQSMHLLASRQAALTAWRSPSRSPPPP